MKHRKLGKCGPLVPAICFGAWPIGGGLGSVDTKQAIAAIHCALDEGINFIDTAEGYQTSESILGKALVGKRHEVILATKLSGDDHSKKHLRSALENSLTSLGTDYIDLYQLHSPQPQWPIEETMSNLLQLKEEGKIRYIGVSNFSSVQTKHAMSYGPIQTSQPRYNLIFCAEEEENLTFCGNNGIGVLPHSVLAKGLLVGKYKPGHTFAHDDERRLFNFFRGELFDEIYSVTQDLDNWAQEQGRDILQLAVAWTLANPAVSSAIVGMKSPKQVKHVAKAADWDLTISNLEEVKLIKGNLRPRWVKDSAN